MNEPQETSPKPEAGQTLAPTAGSAAPDVPVLSILKRHLETSVHYQQVASKIGNPEGYAYVKIPDWEVRQIIEHLERQNAQAHRSAPGVTVDRKASDGNSK